MPNITIAPPLSALVIMISLFCRLTSASCSDFVRLSRGTFLAFLASVMKNSTQLGNLSGNQLLLLLNLGSFELKWVYPKCALSLILRQNLRRSLLRFRLLYLLGWGQKSRFLLSKENSLFEKGLPDKLTTFPKGSNLVLTFDRSVFSSFLSPPLPVASQRQVLLKFDLNSRSNLVEWRWVLSSLVILLDDWLCLW